MLTDDANAVVSEVREKFARLEGLLGEFQKQLSRLAVPVALLTADDVSDRLGCSPRYVHNHYAARGIFTDARPVDKKKTGSTRLFYADEIEVYRTEGARGLKRYRDMLGRL